MQYNYQDENLHFLREKISDIRVALFKSEINSELQLPNNIVEILKVEDNGVLWFFTSCIMNQAEHIDKSFYAYLDFYKKGTGCRLQVSGKAQIAEEDYDSLFSKSNYSKGISERLILVKMKIMQAEYFENRPTASVSWTDKIKVAFQQMFLSPGHRVYDFS